jgi:hypothetical protein
VNNQVKVGPGWGLAGVLLVLLVASIIMCVGWNVGLYGAGIVDHKINLATGFGLAVCGLILGVVLGGRNNS